MVVNFGEEKEMMVMGYNEIGEGKGWLKRRKLGKRKWGLGGMALA